MRIEDVGPVLAIAAASVTVLTGVVLLIRSIVRAELAQNNRATEQVLHQVRNSHESNLRDDVDEVRVGLSTLALSLARVERAVHGAARQQKRQEATVDRVESQLGDHIEVSSDDRAALHRAVDALTVESAGHHPRGGST